MSNFIANSDLYVGQVVEVNGVNIKLAISSSITDLMKIYDGNVYSIGHIGSMLKILFGRKTLFLSVVALRMKNSDDELIYNPGSDIRIIETIIICEGSYDFTSEELKVSFGIETFPLPMQKAYLLTSSEMKTFYSALDTTHDTTSFISFGKYSGTDYECKINVDKLLSQHCAVLGSTGAGKSATVASILHSIVDMNDMHPNIILMDPHGEYFKSFAEKCTLYKAYSTDGDDTNDLKLPYWLMTANEFREFIVGKSEYEATSQNNIVFEALGYARMVEAGILMRYSNDALGESPVIFSDGKSIADYENFDRDNPIYFDLEDLIFHMDKIQGQKANNNTNKSSSDRKDIDSILRKLRILKSNSQLRFLFKDVRVQLKEIMKQFFDGTSIKIIDISGLPNEVSGTMTAIIARLLFQFKLNQNRKEREKSPILLVCEEAHRYVPNSGDAQYKEAQISVKRIAKEGRKYGIGLMLVSQRPSDIESTVLSQCNTWIILKITNSVDKNYISNYLPDNSSSMVAQLSSLSRQDAILVGNAVIMPCRIRVNTLDTSKIPDSNDISFISGWKTQDNTADIDNVIERWVKS